MRYDANCVSVASRPNFSDSFLSSAGRSSGGSDAPGRVVSGFASLSTFFWMPSGQPPSGRPRSPRIICTTDSGNATSTFGSSTCSLVMPLDTIINARSPTTFDDGVTFTMLPNIWFTSA